MKHNGTIIGSYDLSGEVLPYRNYIFDRDSHQGHTEDLPLNVHTNVFTDPGSASETLKARLPYDKERCLDLEEIIRGYDRSPQTNRHNRLPYTDAERELYERSLGLVFDYTSKTFRKRTDSHGNRNRVSLPLNFDERFAVAIAGLEDTIQALGKQGNILHEDKVRFSTYFYMVAKKSFTDVRVLRTVLSGKNLNTYEHNGTNILNELFDRYVEVEQSLPTYADILARNDEVYGDNLALADIEWLHFAAQAENTIPIDLAETIEYDDDGEEISSASSHDQPDVDELCDEDRWNNIIACNDVADDILSYLDERERSVIELRVYEERTLAYVGRALGLTPERIRQIESRAFSKLRNPLISYKYQN